MTTLQCEGVVRETSSGWMIFYAMTDDEFDGPFTTQEEAEAKVYSLRPFDRMVVRRSPPGCMTDSVFMEGSENGRQFQDRPGVGDAYKKACEEAGGTTTGKKYLSQLATSPGDPKAWVSGRGDVEKRLKELGWGCDGAVKTKGRGRVEPPPEPIPIADHIVDRETARELEGQTVTRKEYLRARAKVADRITPPDKKKKP